MTHLQGNDPLSFLNDLVVDPELPLFRNINNLEEYLELSFVSISQEVLFRFLKDSHAAEYGREQWPKEQGGLLRKIVNECIHERSGKKNSVRLSYLNLGMAFGLALAPRLSSGIQLYVSTARAYEEEALSNMLSFQVGVSRTKMARNRYQSLDSPLQEQLSILHKAAWERVQGVAQQASADQDQLKQLIRANELRGYLSPRELFDVLNPLGVTEAIFLSHSGGKVKRSFLENSLTL